ncbi:MAG: hypothetical protein ABIJ74_01090 [archaeon]
MRYSPKEWKAVAILMRDSTYAVLEALTESPKTWTELKTAANLTDGGLQKVLKEMINRNLVEEKLISKKTGFKEKKYSLTVKAKKEKIYEKAKQLKQSLERINKN